MTPIETLLDWLSDNHYYIGNDLLEKVEELKQMEKQQIINAFHKQSQKFYCEEEAEQYYNENFKSK